MNKIPSALFRYDGAGNVVESISLPDLTDVRALAGGKNGTLWFLDLHTDSVGRADSNGTVSLFKIPSPNTTQGRIALGPDGNMWFTEFSANKIAKITPNGSITEYSLPSGYVKPDGIAATPAGCAGPATIWFTVQGALGRIVF